MMRRATPKSQRRSVSRRPRSTFSTSSSRSLSEQSNSGADSCSLPRRQHTRPSPFEDERLVSTTPLPRKTPTRSRSSSSGRGSKHKKYQSRASRSSARSPPPTSFSLTAHSRNNSLPRHKTHNSRGSNSDPLRSRDQRIPTGLVYRLHNTTNQHPTSPLVTIRSRANNVAQTTHQKRGRSSSLPVVQPVVNTSAVTTNKNSATASGGSPIRRWAVERRNSIVRRQNKANSMKISRRSRTRDSSGGSSSPEMLVDTPRPGSPHFRSISPH